MSISARILPGQTGSVPKGDANNSANKPAAYQRDGNEFSFEGTNGATSHVVSSGVVE